MPQEQCAQWEIFGWWDLQLDNYFAGKPETGRVEFRQTGTTLTAAVFIGRSEQPAGGVGTLVGNQLSLGFGVRDPYSKDGGGPAESWTGTVSATAISGSGARVQTQWGQGFQFNWKAAPTSNGRARCATGAAAVPPAGATPPRNVPPECEGWLQARLLVIIYHFGVETMRVLDKKTKSLFTESSFDQADEAYYQIAREKSRLPNLPDEHRHLAGSLSYLAQLRFADGKPAYPTLRQALPVIYTMLRKSKDEVDYLTALDRLLSYIMALDNKARCN